MTEDTANLIAEAYGAPHRPHISSDPPKRTGTVGNLAPGDHLDGQTIITIAVTGYGFRKRATYRRLRIELADGTVRYCASDRTADACHG